MMRVALAFAAPREGLARKATTTAMEADLTSRTMIWPGDARPMAEATLDLNTVTLKVLMEPSMVIETFDERALELEASRERGEGHERKPN